MDIVHIMFIGSLTLHFINTESVYDLMDIRIDSEHLDERLTKLEEILDTLEFTPPKLMRIDGVPKDCEEIYRSGTRKDGVYSISPDGRCPFFVYCDMTNGGWTVIQRRINGSVSFARPWVEYEQGFGDLETEHWIGLQFINRLTKDNSELYIDLEMVDGNIHYAHYKHVTIGNKLTDYTLHIQPNNYEGTFDDALNVSNNMPFSTYDRDNDKSEVNCSKDRSNSAGWWIYNCPYGVLNGGYVKRDTRGMRHWFFGLKSVASITMKVKSLEDACYK